MARGKQTCRILKEIRRRIAEANDIEFITSECTFKGDCLGTCPKCEAEVRYLEQQLRARSIAGKAVALAGISAGLILMSGCTNNTSIQSICVDETSQIEPETQTKHIESQEQDDRLDITAGEVPRFLPDFDSIYVKHELTGLCIVAEENEEISPVYSIEGVDRRPQFPGGDAMLKRFIREQMVYPEEAKAYGIEHNVKVIFEIDTLGHVCNPLVIEPGNYALDWEAIRIMKLLPDFIPAKLDGKRVRVWTTMTIEFNLLQF